MFWAKNRIECESDCPSTFILHLLKQNMGADFDFIEHFYGGGTFLRRIEENFLKSNPALFLF